MRINEFSQRLQKDRPTTMISLRLPVDVLDDLKRVAPLLGFSGYQALVKAYIGQGLRSDLERLEESGAVAALIESLRRQGIADAVISSALAEAQIVRAAA